MPGMTSGNTRLLAIMIWKASATSLTILPGLTWEEWAEKWAAVDQTSRALKWWIGDALAYAEDNFPDRWTQAVDAEYAEQHRGAMWVSRRIPPHERIETLSWSAHREAAALDPEVRREVLALAVEQGWGARQIAEERKRRQPGCSTVEQPPSRVAELRTQITTLRSMALALQETFPALCEAIIDHTGDWLDLLAE